MSPSSSSSVYPQGIVRNAPATLALPSHADAVLNLRPQGGGWKVVGEKQVCYPAYAEGATLLQTAVHQLADHQRLVAVRQLAGGAIEVAAALLADGVAPQWQVLYTFPQGTTVGQALDVRIAFLGVFCCFNVPQLRVFRFSGGAYAEETTAAEGAPPLAYKVQGRYSQAGAVLSFSVPVTGENCEGCYYREVAAGQYPAEFFTASSPHAVVLDQGTSNTPTQWGHLSFDEAASRSLLDAMHGQYLSIQQSSDYYREGYVLVCSAWQLADGSFTSPSEPLLLHLGCEQVEADFEDHQGRAFDPRTDIDVYFNRDKVCFRQFSANGLSVSTPVAAQLACGVRRQWVQQLSFVKPQTVAGDGSVFRKAVFFVSPPVSMYQIDRAEFSHLHTIFHYGTDVATKGLVAGGGDASSFYRLSLCHGATGGEGLREYLPTAADVAGWTLYRAVEFDLADPSEPDTKRVNFSTLTANPVLNAELGGHWALGCAGLMVYNQRLHLWNCSTTLQGTPVSSARLADVPAGFLYRYVEVPLTAYVTERQVVPGTDGRPYVRAVGQLARHAARQVLACFRIAQGNAYLYHYRSLSYLQLFSDAAGSTWLAQPRFLSFPDARCDQCTLVYAEAGGSGWRAVPLAMKPSAAFNFAFAVGLAATDAMNSEEGAYLPLKGGSPVSEADVLAMMRAENQTFDHPVSSVQPASSLGGLRQPDMLMVSAPGNPYVFPPELAYRFGSPVLAAEVSTREISSVQTGQYPLCVFTQGGIWSMQLGSVAFYGSQVPVSAEVSTTGRVLSTPFGIVFLTAGGVKLLQGRQVKLLSGGVEGGVALPVWSSVSMASVVSGGGGALSRAAALAGQHLSYPGGIAHWLGQQAALGYDAAHHELLVGGMGLPLTYVYSFVSSQWYTLGSEFVSFSGDMAVRKSPQATLLCRLGAEVFPEGQYRPVALVSRPFASRQLSYGHLHRLCLRGELEGGAATYAGLYVLASNSLSQWRMVSAVQWRHPLSPQVRLPRSKVSWRFFAYAFFADVPEGFWLGGVELE